jgi:hypothetical protein
MAKILINQNDGNRYPNVRDMRGVSNAETTDTISDSLQITGLCGIFTETGVAETVWVSSTISMNSDSTLEIGPGITLRTISGFSGPIISATSKSNVKVTGDGKILCTSSTVPTFTSVTNLSVTCRIENSSGSPLTYAGTGNTTGQVNPAISTPLTDSMRLKAPRVIKQFNNLNNITFTDSVITSTRVIEQASPFGRPALKLTMTAGGTGGYTEVKFEGVLNIPNFDDHVSWRLWLDNYTRCSQIQLYIGDSGYANVNTYTFSQMAASDIGLFSGPRLLIGGPQSCSSVVAGPTFDFATDSLVSTKIRITIPANVECIIWVDAIEIPARQRPIVCITFDDCDASMLTAADIMEENGLRGTFAINTEDLGDGASFLTNADVQTLSAAGHQVSAHNHNNYKLQTLYQSGINNGTSTSLSTTNYLAEWRQASAILEALGVPPEDLCYHPWVQGGFDGAVIHELRSAGCSIARAAFGQYGSGGNSYRGSNVYGSGFGNYSMALGWVGIGSGITLANALLGLADTVKYGTATVLGFHHLAETSSDSITWAEDNFTSYCQDLGRRKALGQVDVLTMRELAYRFSALGVLDGDPYGYRPDAYVRQIGHLANANFNSTADQAITLEIANQSYSITDIITTNITVSLTTAAGGFYTAAAKGGTAIVAAGQTYTTHTGTATQIQRATIANAGPVSTTLYFSLTTPQGSAATGDIFVFGKPV